MYVARAQDAVVVAEKILAALMSVSFCSGCNRQVSASIGIALYPAHGPDIEQLLKHADLAMYYAKRSGRNKIKVYNPTIRGQGCF